MRFFVLCFALVVSSFASWATGPTLALQLRPVYAAGQVSALSVAYDLDYGPTPPASLDLDFDLLVPMLNRGPDQLTKFVATDKAGVVPFAAPTVVQAQGHTVQRWHATRPLRGLLHVAYELPVAERLPKLRGPHLEVQAAGGGVVGTGVGFLLLPELVGPFSLHLSWQLPAGATAVSTYGRGAQTAQTNLKQLLQTHFLAGPLYQYPAAATDKGFSAYGLGKTAAQLQDAMVWPTQAYQVLRQAFQDTSTRPFRLFFRSYEGGPLASGSATDGSFLLYLPPTTDLNTPDIRALIAHEMVHVWVPGLVAAPDLDDWYAEGLADYLAATIPFAAGLYTPQQYLDLINTDATYYYTNAQRLTPDADIAAGKWVGPNAWTLSYARGMLYFANLDAKLRQAGSPHSVLDFVRQLNRARTAGQSITAASWVELLRREAGEWAVRDWQAMVAGQLLQPSPGAFGLCCTSRPVPARVFEMGFALPRSIQVGRHIEGLVANSAAARAGLREGDEIAVAVNLLPIYSQLDQPVTITVRRGTALVPITYQPRGAQVDAFQWELVPGTACSPK